MLLPNYQIYGLKHNFRIHSFLLTLSCPIIEFLSTGAKFLEPFNFCTTNHFGCISEELDYIACLSVWLLIQTYNEIMLIMSAHQLAQYYQSQQVLTMIWTALVTWYMHHKLACSKILQKFWLALVFSHE